MADRWFSFAGISRQMKKVFLCELCDSVVKISYFIEEVLHIINGGVEAFGLEDDGGGG